jgi:hypothetical protein
MPIQVCEHPSAPSQFGDLEMASGTRIAVLFARPQIAQKAFIEAFSSNRGSNLRVFETSETANTDLSVLQTQSTRRGY